ncbi:hypothetical protein GGS23DRAFT_604120 [Durotheca rogersii]|uniref:uncharacterized protein n=1 Tax=Durotheca rogersii TaxID=419775 RepID=UPI00221F7C19|nr:uncharacterized protein GGS23DRAFT_604120 [Durotheca rogersii]KAI5864467.1 hypothetical protein GGS23DRAFT_604120 [Durotheca rogersii]
MSSDTFSRQVPINGTIQSKVAPGIQTNLYYILVSNLPWQTSWQQLKDHVRSVCAVERVEVFNESTSGWVSVWGRENYDAALRLLNGGVFNGRALLADGKNATETIMIRELVSPSNTPGASSRTPHTPRFQTPPSAQYSSGTSPLMSPTATGYGEWASPTTPSPFAATSTMECTSYTMSVATPYDFRERPGCYTYDTYDTKKSSYLDKSAAIPSPTMVQHPYESAYSQQYRIGDYSFYSGILTADPAANGSSDTIIPTRQRKIIIKQLQPWATLNQVQDLVRKKAGSDADKIQHIDLPLSESQGLNRGYALITFQSEEVASKLIRRLNDYKFEGRSLRVDYTKEGVSENETVRSRASGPKERREDKERKEKKEGHPRGSNSNDKRAKSHKSTVVIAHGSSSSSKKSDAKEKSNKRH